MNSSLHYYLLKLISQEADEDNITFPYIFYKISYKNSNQDLLNPANKIEKTAQNQFLCKYFFAV